MFFVAWEAARRTQGQTEATGTVADFPAGVEDEPSTAIPRRRLFYSSVLFSAFTLMLIMAVSWIVEIPDKVRSITSGVCMLGLATLLLSSVIAFCRQPIPKQPKVLTFVWARLSSREAVQWLQGAANQKPAAKFERHDLRSFAAAKTVTNSASQELEVAAELNQQGLDEGQVAGLNLPTEGMTDVRSFVPSQPEALETYVDLGVSVGGNFISPHMGDVALSPRSSTTAASNSLKSQPSLSCPCCYNSMHKSEEIALLRCGHLFCEGCIQSWATRSTQCPMCRASMLASGTVKDV